MASTTAPFLASLLLFVCSSVSLSGHHSFPEELPWHPAPDAAALLVRVPPVGTGSPSSPRRHMAVVGSPSLLSYARFPRK